MSAPFYRNVPSGTTIGYGGLTPSTTYYVEVKALDSAGADLTAYSAPVAARTLPPQPAPPTGLKATAQTSDHLTMAWNPVAGAVGYRLMYSLKSDMSAPFYRNVPSGTTIGYGGLAPSTTYYVEVKALDSAGADLTAYSAAVTARTLSAPPAPPAGLRSTAQSTTTLSFSWDTAANAPQYRLALSSTADMSNPTYLRTATAFVEVRGLTPATPYYAQVRAISDVGDGITSYSAVVKATTGAVTVLPAVENPLSVASFNIRCWSCNDGLPDETPWTTRRVAVVETIVSKMPDIIGIQEASQTWIDNRPGGYTQFEDVRDRLIAAGASYKLSDSDRNNCVDSTRPTDCVYADKGASAGTKIYYNSKTVKLTRSGSKALPAPAGNTIPRYVAWAEAVQLSTGKRIFFANAHLEVGTGATANDLRKRQALAVMDVIKAKNTGSLPVILVGDMNSNKWDEPSNGPYDVITGQGLTDPLGNTYKSWYPSGAATAEQVVNRQVNSWNGFERTVRQGEAETSGSYIDYIFTSTLRVTYYENVARIDARGKYVGIIPSDHNMQFAKVSLDPTSPPAEVIAPPATVTVTPAAPQFLASTYAVPAVTGVQYKVNGVTTSSGTYAGHGTVTITAVAAAGYVLQGTSSWERTFVVLSDVPAKTAFENEIHWLFGQGISTGWVEPNGMTTFRPLQSVNRDAMAAFMYRLKGKPDFTPPKVSPFKDVPTDSQFYKEITWLAAQQISSGWDEGNGAYTYRPLQPVNRDAMAAFMYRLAGEPGFTPPATSPFRDVLVSTKFYREITWLAAERISSGWDEGAGRFTYRPLLSVNRDAMAAFMSRFNGKYPSLAA